jgi:hypothetical protein
MYFLSVIQKEFNNVSKDVLLSRTEDYLPYSNYVNNNSFLPLNNHIVENGNGIASFNFNKGDVNIKF